MPKVYAPGKLLASSKQSFTSDAGEYVEFYENLIKSEDGVLTMNSKADYSAQEGQEGVATIEARARDDGKGFKLTLKKFSPGESIDLPEEVLE